MLAKILKDLIIAYDLFVHILFCIFSKIFNSRIIFPLGHLESQMHLRTFCQTL